MKKKVALITGTTSGLGLSLLGEFSKKGYTVVSINRRDTIELRKSYPGHKFLVEDIRKSQVMEKVLDQLVQEGLEPDIFVLNAGINQPDNLKGINTSHFQEVLEINLIGNLTVIEAIHNRHLKGKKIITISSTSVVVPNSGSLAYSLGKQNLEQAFDLFRKSDPWNEYKCVRLGPMHRNLNRNLPATQGLQKKIFDILSLSSQIVAEKVVRFSENSVKLLHPSLKVRLFYFALSWALKIVPGIYYKPYPGRNSL